MPDPIVIVDYDPMWPREFETLRERAAAAVGELAVAIEHVGSTAVPGLAAKPVIDLVVVVEPEDVQHAVDRLVAIGYVHTSAWKGERRSTRPRTNHVITSTSRPRTARSFARSLRFAIA